jgi:hypothetical protein
MKTAKLIFIGLMAILSVAAGAAKSLQVPEEVAFLQGLGLSLTMIVIFGVFQIIAGVLLALPKTRFVGAVIATMGFLASALMILISGNYPFAVISMLPVLSVGYIALDSKNSNHSLDENTE